MSSSNAPWNNINSWIQYRTTSNTFNPSYINNFLDISGNVIIRNGNMNFINGNIFVTGNAYVGNTFIGTSITAGNISAINNLYTTDNTNNNMVNGNLAVGTINSFINTNYINGNLNVNNSTTAVTMNGNLFVNGNLNIPYGNLFISNYTGTNPFVNMFNSSNVNFGGINNVYNRTNIPSTISGYLAGEAFKTTAATHGLTAIGSNALQYYNTDNAVAIGSNTLNMYGNATYSGTNKGNLTAVGANAGSFLGDTTAVNIVSAGFNNTFIGANTGQDSSINTWNNSTAIGAGAIITANNQVVLGTSSSVIYCPNKMTIGAYNTTYPLYVNGNTYLTQDVSASSYYMRGLTIPGDLYTAIQKINTGFVHCAEYIGAFSANQYFAIDCSFSTNVADPSNVLYLPNCILYQVYAQSKTNVSSATTIQINQYRDVSTIGNIEVIIPSGNNIGNNIVSSLSFIQGDNINVGFGTTGGGGSIFRVSMLFKYF